MSEAVIVGLPVAGYMMMRVIAKAEQVVEKVDEISMSHLRYLARPVAGCPCGGVFRC